MNPKPPEYAKLRNVLIAKLGLPTDRFQRDNQIAEAVQGVIHERNQLTKLSTDLRTQRDALYERLTRVVDVTGEPTLEELVNVVLKRLDSAQRLEGLVITDMDGNTLYWELSEGVVEINSDVSEGHRDALIKALGFLDHHANMYGLINRVALQHDSLVELRSLRDALTTRLLEVVDVTGETSVSKLVEELIAEYRASERALKEIQGDYRHRLQEIKALRDVQPTHDKRYIVHGDIQPCVVLYSDETTTLVRLDENDMMCETSTIEWSDELTYRCQELGKAAQVSQRAMLDFAKALASLSREDRVLLNDNGGSDNA
ncbi:hypothetical protein VpaJT1_26 [Vibrio phage VpaJT_1]|nr:hypothetical protein VpaJT1_26 [Vibrio phage VpaJT_1]